MKKVSAFAPCRVDLAGGTLDLPPLNILIPSATTVNLAIDIGVEVTVEDSPDNDSHVTILDKNINFTIAPDEPHAMPGGAELVNSVHGYYFDRWRIPVSITTRSYSPPGAGLAASSALCTALVSALSAFFEEEIDDDTKLRRCLDLEARILGTPAGYQDFIAAIHGGLNHITYPPGEIKIEPIAFDPAAFEQHMMLVYTGSPHHSGLNNWEVFKSFVDGNPKVRSSLGQIGTIATRMATDLKKNNLATLPLLLGDEWRMRKNLSASVSTKIIDTMIREIVAKGGAGKVCGAGGGGCVLLWHDGSIEIARSMQQSVERLGCMVIDCRPFTAGCKVTVN